MVDTLGENPLLSSEIRLNSKALSYQAFETNLYYLIVANTKTEKGESILLCFHIKYF